ncbi:TOBE domain-containing protein, partial [Marinobacter pelagius]|uniref:TOBE domain-containing protein n=1 Tax=Marinobacter sp. C7 TaxID=2951363 RepID=UPI001EEFB50D
GKVEQEGAPAEIYARPETEFVSGFIGSANVLPATMETGPVAVLADGQKLAVADASVTGDAAIVLRQEDLAVADAGLKATVKTRVFLGARNRYVLSLAGETIRLLTGNEVVLKPGEDVFLAIDPARVRVLAR